MKIKQGFMLQTVAGSNIVVPTGEKTVDFSGIITLNETGKLLWQALEQGSTPEALADLLVKEYEGLAPDQAKADVAAFLTKLEVNGLAE